MRLTASWELDVRFKRGALDPASPELAQLLSRREPARRQRVLPVLDEGLLAAQADLPERLRAYARAHGLSFTPLHAGSQGLHERFAAERLDRHSHVLAIGGTTLLAKAGYAAATWLRGLRLTRLPTTAAAQAGSGLGLKCGDGDAGVFCPPFGVLVDPGFLDTLPPRARSAGCAEALKTALSCDAAFFRWLLQEPDPLARLEETTRRSAQLQLDHLLRGGDPFEQGRGRALGFGDWSARRVTEPGPGLALDTLLSMRLAGLHAGDAQAILSLIERLKLPLWSPRLESLDASALEEWRRGHGGELAVALLRAPGAMVDVHEVPEASLREAVLRLAELSKTGGAVTTLAAVDGLHHR